jgi:hypothetical protein
MWQWQQLATVVDRLLLVAFFLSTAATTFVFLIKPVIFNESELP